MANITNSKLDLFYFFDIEIPDRSSITEEYLNNIAIKYKKLKTREQSRFSNDSSVNKFTNSVIRSINSFEEKKALLIEYIELIRDQHEKAESLFREAQKLRKQKYFEEALNRINEVISLYPTNLYPYNHRYGDEKIKIEEEKAETENREKADVFYKNAQTLRNQKKFDEALNEIDKALDLIPNDQKYESEKELIEKQRRQIADDNYINAQKLRKQNNFDDALSEINKALGLYPDDQKYKSEKSLIETQRRQTAEDYYNNACLLLERKEFGSALKEIEKALVLYTNDQKYKEEKDRIESDRREAERREKADGYYNNALKLREDRQFDEAIKKIVSALDLYPNDPKFNAEKERIESDKREAERREKADGYYNNSQKLREEGKFDEAFNEIVKALDLYPDDQKYESEKERIGTQRRQTAEHYYKNALKLGEQGQFDEALQNINGALYLYPDEPKYQAEKERIEDDKSEAERREKADEYYNNSRKFREGGKFDEAFSEISRALVLYRNDSKYESEKELIEKQRRQTAEDYYNNAQKRREQKRFDEALKEINLALNLYSNDPKFKAEKERIEDDKKEAERREKANEYYRTAVKLREEGKFDRALSELDKAFDLYPDDSKYESEKELINKKRRQAAEKYFDSAQKLREQKKFAAALNDIYKALDLYSNDPGFRAEKERIENDKTEAERREKADGYYRTAQNVREQREYDEALSFIAKALGLYPDDPDYQSEKELIVKQRRLAAETYCEKARRLGEKRLFDESLSEIDNALALYPDDLNFNAEKERIESDKREAERREQADNHCRKSQDLCEKRLFDEASNEIGKALDLYPDDPDYQSEKDLIEKQRRQTAEDYYNNAQKLREQKLFDDAQNCINSALGLYSDDQRYVSEKDLIEKQRRQTAEDYYNNSLKLYEQNSYDEALNEIGIARGLYPNDQRYSDKENVIKDRLRNIAKEKRNRLIKRILLGICSFLILLSIAFISYGFIQSINQAKADKMCQQAENQLKDKQYISALELIGNALDQYPDNTHYKEVKKSIDDCLENAENLCKQAEELRKKKQFDDASSTIMSAIELYPSCERYQNVKKLIDEILAKSDSLCKQAEILLEKKQYDKAIESIEAAMDIYPYSEHYKEVKDKICQAGAEYFYEEANRQYNDQKYEAAKVSINNSLGQYPDNTQYKKLEDKIRDVLNSSNDLFKQAETLRDEKKYDVALSAIEKAIEIYPTCERYLNLQKSINNILTQSDSFCQRAEELYGNKQYNEALSKINEAIAICPTCERYINLKASIENILAQSDSLCQRAEDLYGKQQYNEALSAITEALKIYPEYERYKNVKKSIDDILAKAEELYNKAVSLHGKGDFRHAFDEIENALKIDPNNQVYKNEKERINSDNNRQIAERCYQNAQNLRKQEKYIEALNEIKMALDLYSKDKNYCTERDRIRNEQTYAQTRRTAENHYQNAQQLRLSNSFDSALKEIEESLVLYPADKKYLDEKSLIESEIEKIYRQDAENHYQKAQELRKQENYKEALKEIDSALNFYSTDKRYLDEKNAIEREKINAENHRIAESHYQEAQKLRLSKDFDKSLSEITQSLDLYPKEPKYLEEKELIEKGMDKLHRQDSEKYYEQAQTFLNQNDFEWALKAIDLALDLYPNDSTYIKYKAKILYSKAKDLKNHENYEEALQTIDKAIELDPNNQDYKSEKGVITYDENEQKSESNKKTKRNRHDDI